MFLRLFGTQLISLPNINTAFVVLNLFKAWNYANFYDFAISKGAGRKSLSQLHHQHFEN